MKLLGTLLLICFVFAVGYIFTHNGRPDASAAGTPAAAQTFNTPDEAAALIAACGAPYQDERKGADAIAPGFMQRTVDYPKIEFQFGLDPQRHEDWTMTGAFREYGSDGTLGRPQAEKLMPCVAKVQFSNDLF